MQKVLERVCKTRQCQICDKSAQNSSFNTNTNERKNLNFCLAKSAFTMGTFQKLLFSAEGVQVSNFLWLYCLRNFIFMHSSTPCFPKYADLNLQKLFGQHCWFWLWVLEKKMPGAESKGLWLSHNQLAAGFCTCLPALVLLARFLPIHENRAVCY